MKNFYFIFGFILFSFCFFSCKKNNNIFGDPSQNYFLDIKAENIQNLGPLALKKEVKKIGTFFIYNPNNWVGGETAFIFPRNKNK